MTQPPTGPPEGPPPWGHGPPPGSRPKRGRPAEIVGGVVVGGILAIILPLVVLGIVAGSNAGSGLGLTMIIVGILLVPLLGVGLLFSGSTRPWGVGILIGWAVAVIVVGGSCVAIIASLNGSP